MGMVQPPSSYPHGSTSSLSVAFEDPDGTKLKTLLAERYLFAFGNRATVKKWKYRLKITKDTSSNNADKHDQASVVSDDEEDVELTLREMPAPVPNPFENLVDDGSPNPFLDLKATMVRRSARNPKPQ
jgi:hypothetical protein